MQADYDTSNQPEIPQDRGCVSTTIILLIGCIIGIILGLIL